MGKIKMVAMDLDKTLLDDRGKISDYTQSFLRKLNSRGVYIALVSGRMTSCITPFANILEIDCPIIAYNGAMVKGRKAEGRELIFHQPLPAEFGDLLIDFAKQNHYHLNYYLKDILYGLAEHSLRKYADIYTNQTGALFNFVPSLDILKGNSPTKLILITESQVRPGAPGRSRDELYNYFYPILGQRLTLTKTNPEYLEFTSKDVNKGVALRILAQNYGLKTSEVMAFGDGENDIPLIEAAGIGVAMANAPGKVKNSADEVTEFDNNNDGLAKFIETKNQFEL